MPPPAPPGRTLHTWKEIATFLDSSVRAVQVWERHAGLPVRRPPGAHGHVTADPDELRRWAASREKRKPWWRHPHVLYAAFWVVPLLLLAILAHDLTEHHGLLASAQVASLLVNGRVVSALDDQRHERWRAEFDAPLDPRAYAGPTVGGSPRWLVEDIDADGRREVLFVEVPAAAGSPHRLHVFDAKGFHRWTYPPRVHDHPEMITVLRTIPAGANQRAIVAHFCGLPKHEGTLHLFSSDGRILTRFQHGGHLDQIAVSGDTVLLGGECARTRAAEVHQFRVVSSNGSIALRNEHELQFGRSCVNRLLGRANRVTGLAALADGYLVTVAELIDEMPYEVYHEMSSAFTPRRCWASDAFLDFHRRLEIEGRLNHPFTSDEEAALCQVSTHAP